MAPNVVYVFLCGLLGYIKRILRSLAVQPLADIDIGDRNAVVRSAPEEIRRHRRADSVDVCDNFNSVCDCSRDMACSRIRLGDPADVGCDICYSWILPFLADDSGNNICNGHQNLVSQAQALVPPVYGILARIVESRNIGFSGARTIF